MSRIDLSRLVTAGIVALVSGEQRQGEAMDRNYTPDEARSFVTIVTQILEEGLTLAKVDTDDGECGVSLSDDVTDDCWMGFGRTYEEALANAFDKYIKGL